MEKDTRILKVQGKTWEQLLAEGGLRETPSWIEQGFVCSARLRTEKSLVVEEDLDGTKIILSSPDSVE